MSCLFSNKSLGVSPFHLVSRERGTYFFRIKIINNNIKYVILISCIAIKRVLSIYIFNYYFSIYILSTLKLFKINPN